MPILPTIPDTHSNEGYLTINKIRVYVVDEVPEDNPLTGDLMWSDHDILAAMDATAKAYNRLEPHVEHVHPHMLYDFDDMFQNGVAADLYRRTLARLRRRDIDYSAGEVQASVTKSRIKHFEQLQKEHQENFLTAAQARKLNINLNAAFGHYS